MSIKSGDLLMIGVGMILGWFLCGTSNAYPIPTEPPDIKVGWRGLLMEPENSCSKYDPRGYRYDRRRILDILWHKVGAFFSPYDNNVYSHSEVDIEHRVARHQAHVSGMCARDMGDRREFASDLNNITIAESNLNRVIKGSKDAAGWVPAENRCHFAVSVIRTKCVWRLSVDQAEAIALDDIIGKDCKALGVDVGECVRLQVKESDSI